MNGLPLPVTATIGSSVVPLFDHLPDFQAVPGVDQRLSFLHRARALDVSVALSNGRVRLRIRLALFRLTVETEAPVAHEPTAELANRGRDEVDRRLAEVS